MNEHLGAVDNTEKILKALEMWGWRQIDRVDRMIQRKTNNYIGLLEKHVDKIREKRWKTIERAIVWHLE